MRRGVKYMTVTVLFLSNLIRTAERVNAMKRKLLHLISSHSMSLRLTWEGTRGERVGERERDGRSRRSDGAR